MAMVSLAPAAATPLAAQDVYDILEEAADRFAGVTTLCADFHQTLSVPLLGQEKEGWGRLCQTRPDLFSMRFDEPEGDLVVVDGEHAWVYTPSQSPDQVIRARTTSLGPNLDFYREFMASPREKYDAVLQGSEAVAGTTTRRILLTPKEPALYREAVVWIDPETDLMRRLEIREENGSVRVVTLDDIRLDPGVPEGLYTFTPPPGAQVITP